LWAFLFRTFKIVHALTSQSCGFAYYSEEILELSRLDGVTNEVGRPGFGSVVAVPVLPCFRTQEDGLESYLQRFSVCPMMSRWDSTCSSIFPLRTQLCF